MINSFLKAYSSLAKDIYLLNSLPNIKNFHTNDSEIIKKLNRASSVFEIYSLMKCASIPRPELIRIESGIMPKQSEHAGKKIGSFRIGVYEITFDEWNSVVEWSKGMYYDLRLLQSSTNTLPVNNVSFYDCLKWCNAKSEMECESPVYLNDSGGVYRSGIGFVERDHSSDGYRLPTENEWEWAAIGGKNTNNFKFSGGNDLNTVAWWKNNSDNSAHPVGTKKPNELGLYDMTGNVSEWCWAFSVDQNGNTEVACKGDDFGTSNIPWSEWTHNNYTSRSITYEQYILNVDNFLTPFRRQFFNPSTSSDTIGFRIAAN